MMASALASLPPPFRFGTQDPRASARNFLERALVISALVHLSVVAAVRVAGDRAAALRGGEALVEKGERITILCPVPPSLPWTLTSPAPPKTSDAGIFFPSPKKPEIELPGVGIPGPEPAAAPDEKRGSPGPPTGGTPCTGPPTDDALVFTHVDTPPVPVDAPKPTYPDWAREAGVEGKVLLRVLVGVDGLPMQVVIVAGPKGLTEEAQRAVERWRFSPGLSGGIPVRVWVEVPVVFRL